jgi:hypothetical protein
MFVCVAIVNGAYLSFSLVVYRSYGQCIASPSLRRTYSIAFLMIDTKASPERQTKSKEGCVWYWHGWAYRQRRHLLARRHKYLFVRFLRNSLHLQANTTVHWGDLAVGT